MGVNITALLEALVNSKSRQLFSLDFWSAPQEEVAVPAAPVSQNFNAVTIVGLPAGATIVRAVVMFKFRVIENSNALANGLDGAQHIEIQDDGGGAWTPAISLAASLFTMAAIINLRESGDVLIGDHNVSGAGFVDANDTYNIRWTDAHALQDSLLFNDVQVGIRIWYSV